MIINYQRKKVYLHLLFKLEAKVRSIIFLHSFYFNLNDFYSFLILRLAICLNFHQEELQVQPFLVVLKSKLDFLNETFFLAQLLFCLVIRLVLELFEQAKILEQLLVFLLLAYFLKILLVQLYQYNLAYFHDQVKFQVDFEVP